MTTHATAILERLRTDLESGTFAPGTKLSEPKLAERFGVSRTPIREVLMQLAALGLVERHPHKGCRVVAESHGGMAMQSIS